MKKLRDVGNTNTGSEPVVDSIVVVVVVVVVRGDFILIEEV